MKNVRLQLKKFMSRRETRSEKLHWNSLVEIAILALVVWVIVQNNGNANTMAQTLIQQAQQTLVNLFSGIGSL